MCLKVFLLIQILELNEIFIHFLELFFYLFYHTIFMYRKIVKYYTRCFLKNDQNSNDLFDNTIEF